MGEDRKEGIGQAAVAAEVTSCLLIEPLAVVVVVVVVVVVEGLVSFLIVMVIN